MEFILLIVLEFQKNCFLFSSAPIRQLEQFVVLEVQMWGTKSKLWKMELT